MSTATPDEYRSRAMAAERDGDMDTAKRIFADGLAKFPDNAALANSAANLAMRLGDFNLAEGQFMQASELDPANLEFTLNHAIALTKLGRHGLAISILQSAEEPGQKNLKYCSARGAAERAIGNLVLAAKWYDQAIALKPNHARAVHGRARVAIEQGDPSASQRFDAALAITQVDADLWLGKAQALDVAGNTKSAREIAEALVEQAPHWTEGLRYLSQLKLGAGESDFATHYAEAVRHVPQDPNILAAWVALLEGNDRFSEAAEIAADARRKFPEMEQFALAEAVNSGSAGDDDRAEAIFADLKLGSPGRHLQEARHRIRRGELGQAEDHINRVLVTNRWNISAFALLGIIWRMKDDKRTQGRARWLHNQAELVRLIPLIGADEALPDAIQLLHTLHDSSPLPLGLSLRGGTQTRGKLFDRTEPAFDRLRAALLETIEVYRAGLPAADTAHPLLRHRDAGWKMAGSWSVRLDGGGDFHTSHIHPQGLVSSALYLELPETSDVDAQEGWLEIGRPPPDLRLDLPPLRTIEPKSEHLALFPSTLYHGTRPFSTGRRMTVAFDVALSESEPK